MMCAEGKIELCALVLCLRYRLEVARELLAQYGSVKDAFDRAPQLRKFNYQEYVAQAEAELAWAHAKHIRVLCATDPEFPQRLLECPDPPLLLFVYGPANLNREPMLSVVGTRKATYYGRHFCDTLMASFSFIGIQPVIVSGLAFGIDGAAHKYALSHGLPTLAVLPTGLDRIYPESHRSLARDIVAAGGALLTEYPRQTENFKFCFLQRNRLIAGLSQATLVVESKKDGGSLITAHFAHGYHRDVMAVPGRVGDMLSQGCLDLIRDQKAAMITCAEDIALLMNWIAPGEAPSQAARQQRLFETLSEEEKQILLHLQEYGGTIDQIHRQTGIPIPRLSILLTQLELRQIIHQLPNQQYSL